MKNRIFSGLNTRAPALAAFLMGVFAHGAQAQGNYYDRESYRQEAYISIYEHCDFKGERRDIAVGDFASMRELDFDNDSMSSIQVPRELEAIIFEHDRFKGDYARVDRDVRCFDGNWNDQVSSLKVVDRDRRSANRSQAPSTVYGGSNSYNDQRTRNNYRPRDGVTGLNVNQFVFGGKILQKVASRVWQTNDSYGGRSRYTEVNSSRTRLELQNQNSSERISFDMVANTALVDWGRGNVQTYAIDSRLAGSPNVLPNNNQAQDNRIYNQCFNYRVYTNGKAGSLRFSNSKDLFRFDGKGYSGRNCHRGELTIALGKRDFNTDLTMEIDGKVFKFAAGEKETQYRANWYRKVFKLNVGP